MYECKENLIINLIVVPWLSSSMKLVYGYDKMDFLPHIHTHMYIIIIIIREKYIRISGGNKNSTIIITNMFKICSECHIFFYVHINI